MFENKQEMNIRELRTGYPEIFLTINPNMAENGRGGRYVGNIPGHGFEEKRVKLTDFIVYIEEK
ncbi:MAG: hypothetical protein AB9866_13950 [Syntrophobacteraceae bacterium]